MEHTVSALRPEERLELIGLLRKLGHGAEELLEGYRTEAIERSHRRPKLEGRQV